MNNLQFMANKIKNVINCRLFKLIELIETDDLLRRKSILNVLLRSFIIVSAIAQIVSIYCVFIFGNKLSLIPLFAFITFNGLLFLSNHNYPRVASFILLFFLLLITFNNSLTAGINNPQDIVTYALIIISGGILIGPLYLLISTIVICLILFIIFFVQSDYVFVANSLIYGDFKYADLMVLLLFYMLMAVISWLYSREISNSLKRAKKSEKEAINLADELQKERDHLEIKVEERTRQLRESQLKELTQINNLAEFGRMSAGLLHDIKNPLTVISLNLDSLKSAKDKETLELVNKSLLAAKTAETIIKTSQKQISNNDDLQEFDLVNEIKNTMLLVEHRALREKVKIEFKNNFKKLLIKNYPGKISRILANLLMNAIDSFYETEKEDKNIEVELIKNKKEIIISIKDNGCGISFDKYKNIFKAGISDKKIEGRVGFGLYGSKKIANEDLKGDLFFESKINIGSKFILTIPYGK